MTHHFKIVIEGEYEDIKNINKLYENLKKGEIWNENCVVCEPEITLAKPTRCYRCGKYCEWDGPTKTYPRVLDVKYPSCPADSPMPKEFRDDGS